MSKGDILVALSGATTGKFGIYKYDRKAYLNQRVARFRPKQNDSVANQWLYYFFHYKRQEILKEAWGGAQPNISTKKIEAMEIPYPKDLDSLIKKLDVTFGKIDLATSEIKQVEALLGQYKQSILNSAIRGKLVPQDPKDEPATKLLEKIKKEKEKLIKDKKIKKKKPLTAISEDEIPFELPENWTWAKLGDVFNVFVGSTPSRKENKFWGGKISWVSSGEVCFQDIHKTKETITQKGLDGSSCNIHPSGTVMLGMIGEGKTRGQAGILRIEATHNQNTAAIRIGNTGCSSEYLYYYLMANYENNRKIGSGNNQKALNKDRIRNFLFPLPPLKEQHRIAEKILNYFKVVDDVESTLNNNLSQSNLLKQSILKKAFEGKL